MGFGGADGVAQEDFAVGTGVEDLETAGRGEVGEDVGDDA